MVAQVSQVTRVQVVLMVVLIAIHNAIINVIMFIVLIVPAAIIAINVQTAKLVIHNVFQIINVFVRIYIHFQPGMCCHLHHCINNIQLSIHYI